MAQTIAAIAFQNKGVVYAIMFRAFAETLRKLAAELRHLGAEIGFIAVRHSRGLNLHYHLPLHCIVPGCGLTAHQSRWVASRPEFLPVRVLSRLFPRLFLKQLKQTHDLNHLRFLVDNTGLAGPSACLQSNP